ncbi:hypothetical protein ACT4EA_004182 [Escherichia coli]
MSSTLKQTTWYHGTNLEQFTSWKFPPPKKPDEPILFPLTAVYLTSDLAFAKIAGENIATVKLKNSLKILNLVKDKDNAESIRQLLNEKDLYKYSETTKKGNWQKGCKNGECTIYKYEDERIHQEILRRASNIHQENKDIINELAAVKVVMHNMHRAHIENICNAAKKLGFNGIFFHEGDRHTTQGILTPQPVLAIFSPGVISDPVW